MAVLTWDETGKRLYETGVNNVALYVYDKDANKYGTGVAWNGITTINETPSGAEANPIYADNIKYLTLRSVEELAVSIEAYTYPDEFAICDGSASYVQGVNVGQQTRAMFGLAYKTKIGNDVDGDDHGYKLHLIYGCTAAPSERSYQTINDSPEAINFSWEVETTPIAMSDLNPDFKPSSIITIDSTQLAPEKLTALEAKLFGTADGEATLPTPAELKTLLQ